MYEWVLELDTLVAGKRRTITVKNGDQPFRTSARGTGPQYAWQPSSESGPENPKYEWMRSGPPC